MLVSELRILSWLFVEVEEPRRPDRMRRAEPLLKIVYLNPTGVLGGAEMYLLDLLASLRAARPEWRLVVVLGDDGPLREAVEALGVPCKVLPLPRTSPAWVTRVWRSLGRNRAWLALAARDRPRP